MKEYPLIFSVPMVQANHAGRKRMTRRVVDMDRLKVVMRREVRSDLPAFIRPTLVAPKAAKLSAALNPYGAVSCIISDRNLGLKPGEFDFVCPYAHGETVLTTAGGKQTWTIIPRESAVWVRENFWQEREGCTMPSGEYMDNWRWKGAVAYMAEHPERNWGDKSLPWGMMASRPSIHMPRWACRDIYPVTKVRLERLQDISAADAAAEGIELERWKTGVYGPHDPGLEWDEKVLIDGFRSLWDSLNGKKPGRVWADNPWIWVVEYDNPLWKGDC